jgi:hypothetical protein
MSPTIYNKGDGLKDPHLDKDIRPLALTEPEIDDLVAFLPRIADERPIWGTGGQRVGASA